MKTNTRVLGVFAALSLSMGLGTAAFAQGGAQAEPAKPPAPQPSQTAPAPTPPADKAPSQAEEEKLPVYWISTSMGEIVIEVDAEKAPISAKNFDTYVREGFYAGTIFHRVIPDFMIQGGGFTKEMAQKPTKAPIKNEWRNGLKNVRGSIAMARTPVADSATSQFFINLKHNTFLDEPRDGAAYAVFGRVMIGMDVVDRIAGVRTEARGVHQNVPAEPVEIRHVTRLQRSDADHVRQKGTFAPSDVLPPGMKRDPAVDPSRAGADGQADPNDPGRMKRDLQRRGLQPLEPAKGPDTAQ
jgi:cyclophilin family peptidyl-prolyl cis-trans isomerase